MIQIFGSKKCTDTKKALRFFKERGIPVQFVDVFEKNISPGELDSVIAANGTDAIIDTSGKAYADKGLAYMEYDPREEVLENPALLKTPVVRMGRSSALGHDEAFWKGLARDVRK